MSRPRSSRQRYDVFRHDYAQGTLDDKIAGAEKAFAHVSRLARARAAGRVPVRGLRAQKHRIRDDDATDADVEDAARRAKHDMVVRQATSGAKDAGELTLRD